MDDKTTRDTPAPEAGEAPEVEDLRRQLEEKQDQLLRALAEADNVRRRAQRDREEYLKYANEPLLRDLIPLLDNFDRALEAARQRVAVRAAGRSTTGASGDPADFAASVVEGVELVRRELLRALERHGITRYSALGEPFDPTRHEAVARVVTADAAPDTVVREQAPGYVLRGRVLRPALVGVAAAPGEDTA